MDLGCGIQRFCNACYKIKILFMPTHIYISTVPNTEMDLRETGWGGMGWIDLAQDRDQWGALVNTVMDLRVP
jgi:hypothetical protein